jgi:uncharacterized protein YkwD
MPSFRRTLPRVLCGAVFLALVLLVAQTSRDARPAEALVNCTVSDSFDSEEQRFLQLINNYRAQSGLSTLTASVNLNRAAAWMARDMATKNYFSHTDSLGRSVGTRIANCDGLGANGENIAAGTYRSTAQSAFDAWRNSSGHNANMLYASYRQIGIARYYDANSTYKWYWVTDFSTSNDGTNAGGSSGGTASPSPTPAPTSTKASMISPTNGSTIGSTTVLSWTTGSGALQYYLYIGTSQGSSNLFSGSVGKSTSVTLRNLPTGTIYVRLWTQLSSGWQFNDYWYRVR